MQAFKAQLTTPFKTKGVIEYRDLNKGDIVDLYRNLNKPSYFSCKQRGGKLKGKVCAYAKCFVIKNPRFAISEASRLRVIEKGQRNVHAFIRGEFVGAIEKGTLPIPPADAIRCTYNPYFAGYFFDRLTKNEIDQTSIPTYAILIGSDVYLTNQLTQK